MMKHKSKKSMCVMRILITAIMLTLTAWLMPSNMQTAEAAEYSWGPKNPQTADDGTTTWDSVYFGRYKQSSDGNGGYNNDEIKWRVLSVADGDIFLLADKNLDGAIPYNNTRTDVTWETCTMRSWLNGYGAADNICGEDYSSNNFMDSAFSPTEQDAIKTTTVVNSDNPEHGTAGGNNTNDKIYLLSIAEAMNTAYGFTDSESDTDTRKAVNTAYTWSKGGMRSEGSADDWWLRSPGKNGNYAASITNYGKVDFKSGGFVDSIYRAVRPALHLDPKAAFYLPADEGGKSNTATGMGLKKISQDGATAWKLAYKDSERADFTAENELLKKNTAVFFYENAIAYDETDAPNEYISAMITDKDISESGCKIKYYGRIARPADTGGMATLYLAGRYSDGDKVYVFSEQYNRDKSMDYTSDLQELKIAPKAPASVRAALSSYNAAKVTWSAVSGASGYEVYYKKSSAGDYTLLTDSETGTSYSKSGLAAGANYTFKVVPYTMIGSEKCRGTAKVSSALYTLKKLNTPKVKKSSKTKVKVSWINILGESGYQISKSAKKSGTSIVSTYSTTTGTSKVLKVKKNKKYYYKVRAYKTVSGKKIYAQWSETKAYKLK